MAEYKGCHKCEKCGREFDYSFATADDIRGDVHFIQLDNKNWATIIPPSKDGFEEYDLKMHCPRQSCDHINYWKHKTK